ncbi:MAG TPA: MFS transporter [Actinomycetota bacterium]|nr:MFS transporter [Actinomycetota bacterium]
MSVIRSLIPQLPRRAWTVLAGDACSAFGSGLVLPFLIVYLRDVRRISVDTAGLIVATVAMVSLAAGPAAGWLVDRVGSRRALLTSLVLSALGAVAIAGIHSVPQAFAASALFGLGMVFLWPASHSLLMSVVTPAQRSSVLSVHYATLNAGLGIGGVFGGLVADVGNPRSFELLYLIDALTFVAFAGLLFKLRDIGGPVEPDEALEDGRGGYRQVLSDRVFLRLCALGALLVAVGYAQLESGYPAFATGQGGIGTRTLGFTFAVNTSVIVIGQLVILKKLAGVRRTRALAVMCVLWASAWLITLAAGNASVGWFATAGFMVAMGVFALGETFMSPTLPAMVNDLAPESLRGRYNGAYSMSWSVGHMIGPAVAGFALEHRSGNSLFAALVVACGIAGIVALRLERHLPPRANLVGGDITGAPPPLDPIVP